MIDQAELGRRLRTAREACGMTQEEAAAYLDLSRLTYAGIEQGKRAVSTVELEKLAFRFARDFRDFLGDDFQASANPLTALFRAHPEYANHQETMDTLRRCLELGRELTNLEALLGLRRDTGTAAAYALPRPTTRWEAIEQGNYVAVEERRRLGLGVAPLGDMAEFLEAQGVRTAVEDLPNEISGITLTDKDIGVFVMINRRHTRERRRFSHAHEYAHVLLDRNEAGMVSHKEDRTDLLEVRANAFASAFLVPEEGVRQVVTNLGKGRSSRPQADIFDGFENVLHVQGRRQAGSQEIRLLDLVELAHHFRVSRIAMIWRLKNLDIIDAAEVDTLRRQDESTGLEMARLLRCEEPPEQAEQARDAFRRRFVLLAATAYAQDKISRTKLKEVARSCGDLKDADLENFLANVDAELEGADEPVRR